MKRSRLRSRCFGGPRILRLGFVSGTDDGLPLVYTDK